MDSIYWKQLGKSFTFVSEIKNLKETRRMKKFFNNFLRHALIIFLIMIIVGNIGRIYYPFNFAKFKYLTFVVILLLILFIYLYKRYKKGNLIFWRKLLEGINLPRVIIIAFILRILWIILIPTIPQSDFALMYEYAEIASQGIYHGFKGTSYFARFAHDIITVLYFSLFYRFTSNPLWWIKFFNVIFSTVSVYLIYLLIKELYNEKTACIGALLLALYPPYIMYTSETMSENMAIPFYILSIYIFIKSLKLEKNHWLLLLCGACLSIGNMFRMVGIVVLVAYGMYSFIYKGFIKGIKNISLILIAFIIPIYVASSWLMQGDVIENHLWQSKESYMTSILKGTNIKYYGMWNPEDAQLPIDYNYDSEKIEAASKAIIKERFKNTPPLEIGKFYITKLMLQWITGDFFSVLWTVENASPTVITNFLTANISLLQLACSIYFIMVLILSLKEIRLNDFPEEINFFYILLGGFIILYLITEVQGRYSFIIGWIFIIFAVQALRRNSPWLHS